MLTSASEKGINKIVLKSGGWGGAAKSRNWPRASIQIKKLAQVIHKPLWPFISLCTPLGLSHMFKLLSKYKKKKTVKAFLVQEKFQFHEQ